MPDYFKAELTPLSRKATDGMRGGGPGLKASGVDMARDGYSVLERADKTDPFNYTLQGIAPPVSDDQPHVAWDEEK